MISPSESSDRATPAREALIHALQAFEPEDPEADRVPSAITTSSDQSAVTEQPPFSERPPVSLAALKSAGIQFDGDEAVAIGQALCGAIMSAHLLRRITRDPDAGTVSSPITTESVFIDLASRIGVTVNEPPEGPEAIRAVGRILSDILPTDIRILLEFTILSKALPSPPEFETLEELSKALAIYEQRNGRKLIEAVYKRWQRLQESTTAMALAAPVAATPTLSPPDLRPTLPFRSGYRAIAVASAAITAVVILGITGWFLVGSLVGPTLAEESTVEVNPASLLQATPIIPPSAADFTALKAALLDQRARGGRPNFTASLSPLARTEPTVLSAPPSLVSRAAQPSVSNPTTRQKTLPTPSPAAPPTRNADADVTSGVRNTDDVRRTNGAPVEAAAPERGNNGLARSRGASPLPMLTGPLLTFSADDANVAPPVPVLPRLIAGLHPDSPGVRLDALTIAVVVEPDGTAYSVTAVNPPQNMGEYVLLTAALAAVKSWNFNPATKEGVPVRYKLIVPVRSVTAPAR